MRAAGLPVWGVVPVLCLLVAACGGGEAGGPRALRPGADACAYCSMMVDDPRRAAQLHAGDGRILVFDEPGCMLGWMAQHPGAARRVFVADGDGGGWVPAEEAVYVRGGIRTPMGFDIVAYASRREAERAAGATGGTVLTWTQLQGEGGDHVPHH